MASPSVLTPEQQAFLETAPLTAEPHRYRRRQARVIAEAGNLVKADRVENCGRHALMRAAADGCVRHQIQHCMTDFCCEMCSKMRVQMILERWKPLLGIQVEKPGRMALVTLMWPADPRPEAIRKLLDSINPDDRPHWRKARRYDREHGMVEVLLLVPDVSEPLSYWIGLFPKAEVTVSVAPMYRLAYFFEHEFLKPFVPADTAERGHQEVIFDGLRKLRSHGLRTLRDELIARDCGPTAINSASVDNKGDVEDEGCQTCCHGHPFTHRTPWFSSGDPIPPAHCVEWIEIRRRFTG